MLWKSEAHLHGILWTVSSHLHVIYSILRNCFSLFNGLPPSQSFCWIEHLSGDAKDGVLHLALLNFQSLCVTSRRYSFWELHTPLQCT